MNTDRRSQPRKNLRVPLFLLPFGSSQPIQTATENVSTDGLFCYVKAPFPIGHAMKFLLLLPSAAGDAQSSRTMYLEGLVHVTHLRAEPSGADFGLGFHLTSYRVLCRSDIGSSQELIAKFTDSVWLAGCLAEEA